MSCRWSTGETGSLGEGSRHGPETINLKKGHKPGLPEPSYDEDGLGLEQVTRNTVQIKGKGRNMHGKLSFQGVTKSSSWEPLFALALVQKRGALGIEQIQKSIAGESMCLLGKQNPLSWVSTCGFMQADQFRTSATVFSGA